jgi:hypothetical protein
MPYDIHWYDPDHTIRENYRVVGTLAEAETVINQHRQATKGG